MTIKKKVRKSPDISAQISRGEKMIGNDGNMYISEPDKNGVYKWKKMGNVYQIHNNGDNPYSVELNKTNANIYNNHTEKMVKKITYKNVFIGDNLLKIKKYAPKGKYKGNSFLFELPGNKYFYIGSSVYDFKTVGNEKIVKYYSPLGNNYVPYPYAIGENNTYLFAENVIIPNDLLDLKLDAYTLYYDTWFNDREYINSLNLKKIKRKIGRQP
jgi:hypothetical protein